MRAGFSIIELIVSIVIMAIVVVSVPSIIALSSNANTKSLVSQSVMSAKTQLALILRSPFSCAYINQRPNAALPMFVDFSSDKNFYDQSTNLPSNFYKFYGLATSERRHFVPENLLQDNVCMGDLKSIDDFNGATYTITPQAGASHDFIIPAKFDVKISAFSSPFNAPNDPTKALDAKLIQITANALENERQAQIRLYAISSNIGERGTLHATILR